MPKYEYRAVWYMGVKTESDYSHVIARDGSLAHVYKYIAKLYKHGHYRNSLDGHLIAPPRKLWPSVYELTKVNPYLPLMRSTQHDRVLYIERIKV